MSNHLPNHLFNLSILLLLVLITQINSSKIIVFSFDGFRHDYLQKAETAGRNISAFNFFKENGIHVNFVENAFASFTIPSHYTMVTGLYEESHGIMENRFFDPKLNRTFDVKSDSDMSSAIWFNNSETIWVTNQKNYQHSGIFYWVGSTAPSMGHYPTYSFGIFNKKVSLRYEIDRVLDWFVTDDKMTLGMIYYLEPDATGHKYGPNSDQILDRIEEINTELTYLISRLKALNLYSEMNIVLTSDHGMTDLKPSNRIFLEDYVNTEDFRIYHDGCALKQLWPKYNKFIDRIFHSLDKMHPHMSVYTASTIPERFHYKNNHRVAPILLLADEGWSIVLRKNSSDCLSGGVHGYDPKFKDMRPFLIGFGPAFKQNYSLPSIRSVDIFPLIARVLSLENLPAINGSVENILPLLNYQYSFTLTRHTKIVYTATFSFVFLLSLIFCITAIRQPRLYRASLIYRMTQPSQQPISSHHHKSKRDQQDQAKSLLIPVEMLDDDQDEL